MRNPQIPPKPYEDKRSPEWPKVREAHLKEQPTCQACGGTEDLEVHHMKPFHLFPDLELDDSNLLTLCEKSGHDCHFHFGHLFNWSWYNPFVLRDTQKFLGEIKGAELRFSTGE